jgi:hypothetical protein
MHPPSLQEYILYHTVTLLLFGSIGGKPRRKWNPDSRHTTNEEVKKSERGW